MSDRTMMNGKPVFTVPAKTVINFKSHFDKKLLCDGMTFTAGSACAYSCSFCYVESMMTKQRKWLEQHGVTGDHFDHVVRRENAAEIARQQILSKPEEFRMEKHVIYASPLVDVAANMDLVRETVQICKVILGNTNWHIRLLSKSNLLPKVVEGLINEIYNDIPWPISEPDIKGRMIFGVSTGTLDDGLAAAFEEGTPKVSKRIESLHWLQDRGYRTFGMICPSLPQGNYMNFSRKMAAALRVDRCEHVWAEVINVRGSSMERTVNCLEEAGYVTDAGMLCNICKYPDLWEEYSRQTFDAHSMAIPHSKLRFLQYVTKDTAPWWRERESEGAVLL